MTDLAAVCRRAGNALSDLGVALREIAATAEAVRKELAAPAAQPWSVVTDAGLGVFLKQGDTIVAEMTRADSAALAERMAEALNRAEAEGPRS